MARLRQPALSIVQSGTHALITWNDGNATTVPATIRGTTLMAGSLTAAISGKNGGRKLQGTVHFDGCAPAAFQAARTARLKPRIE
jgi:hypothetical protein